MQWRGSILRRYELCSGVAAYYVKSIFVCMHFVVQNEADKDYRSISFSFIILHTHTRSNYKAYAYIVKHN